MDSTTKPRLKDQFRSVMRAHHYSIRTEKSYWYWIRFYLRFNQMRHPLELGTTEVNRFLSWLATERQVAAATQSPALNALVFLYAKVLQQPLGNIGEVIRVRRPARLPVVLTHDEAIGIIGRLRPPHNLLASLMYGSGLRVVEATRLRIKDVDFSQQLIVVRNGKGGKDRTTLLPSSLVHPLRERIEMVRQRWQAQEDFFQVAVSLPFALRRKYPNAGNTLAWQWLFPSSGVCLDEDGNTVRHHVHVSSIQGWSARL